VTYLAHNAVNLWLAGRVAYRRIVEHSKEASPIGDAARSLLEANYMALLEQFARATTTIAVPRMQTRLRDLRETLAAAMAQT
jgi:hypothetical protein